MTSRLLLTAVLLTATLLGHPTGLAAKDFVPEPLPDSVFQRMKGKSYPEDCTIPRADLRYLPLLHYDLQGRVRHGELVCHHSIALKLAAIFRQLYQQRYPIASVRLIDDFGADDERSMQANNTSCFCFRRVKGTGTLSKHARGLAIDVNPLYNPCVRRLRDGSRQVQPTAGAPYANRTAQFPCKIGPGDLCHRLFTAAGFRWGGAWRTVKDYQHFEWAE